MSTKRPRRERRAADPAQPALAMLSAWSPHSATGFALGEKELFLFVADTITGMDADFPNPLVDAPIDVSRMWYQLDGEPRKSFVSGIAFSTAAVVLVPDDPAWVPLAAGIVFGEVWQRDVRGRQKNFLAPFGIRFEIEA